MTTKCLALASLGIVASAALTGCAAAADEHADYYENMRTLPRFSEMTNEELRESGERACSGVRDGMEGGLTASEAIDNLYGPLAEQFDEEHALGFVMYTIGEFCPLDIVNDRFVSPSP